MSNKKKEKACWGQFYFQNAVFTEKEPDEDQDDKDYVDIWLKWSNCTNKYIYVSIIGCVPNLHARIILRFDFCKEGDLWSWHPACDQLCSQSPRLEADIRGNLLRLRLSLHQLTPTSSSTILSTSLSTSLLTLLSTFLSASLSTSSTTPNTKTSNVSSKSNNLGQYEKDRKRQFIDRSWSKLDLYQYKGEVEKTCCRSANKAAWPE